MKKTTTVMILLMLVIAIPSQRVKAQIPVVSIITSAIKKVIRQIDLQIQKQQNKVIGLQNAQKELENAMSKTRLNEISEWTQKQKKLYNDYFQELWRVKNAIATYAKIKNMVLRQKQIVEEYGHAWNLMKQDDHFTAQELKAMYSVYSGIMDESLKNMDQMEIVANSFSTQMSDGKRMELINSASVQQEKNMSDLRSFNNHNIRLSMSRASDQKELEVIKKIYGIQ